MSAEFRRYVAILSIALTCATTGCAQAPSTTGSETAGSAEQAQSTVERQSITDEESGGHAITADGEEASYTAVDVVKTGDSEGDEADFYGENSAVFATNGATLELEDITVNSDGTHANAVFSYGENTTVNISDSTIDTAGDCSGGVMVTGGGTLNAKNLTVHTAGRSSASIRSDRGGGTENVSGGTYTTEGTGSPAIYSTADVNVEDAELSSAASQGVVVEGKNSVSLKNVELTADHNKHNGNQTDLFQAVMIYQSMSGDAAQGEASFSAENSSITNKNGDIFFVNNTVCSISLTDTEITNEDAEGVFLRAEAAGWGNEGSNGGHVTLNASDQRITGDMLVDDISILNLYLKDSSSFEGAIDPDGDAGEVYVELDEGSTWKLTADSHITSLSCDADAIDLNGHTLYVGGTAYTEGSGSTGEAIVVEIENTGSAQGGPGGTPPDGASGGPGGTPPDGAPPEGAPGGAPPDGATPPGSSQGDTASA